MSERKPKAVANDTVQTTTYRRGELCSPVFICYELTGDRIFSLPCKVCGSPVETSAFNAEAPTEPVGETVGCCRELGGIVRSILYKFIKMTAPSKMGRKHELNCISNGVGRWLAAAVVINGYMAVIGCYQIEFNIIP